MDFMGFRFWIGLWNMVALLLIVAFDLSALVKYITRCVVCFAFILSVVQYSKNSSLKEIANGVQVVVGETV